MKAEIEALITNTIRLDETITPEMAATALQALRGISFVRSDDLRDGVKIGRLFRRKELAERFRVSGKTISNWAKAGRLDTVKDSRGQSLGYTPESVAAIYRGER